MVIEWLVCRGSWVRRGVHRLEWCRVGSREGRKGTDPNRPNGHECTAGSANGWWARKRAAGSPARHWCGGAGGSRSPNPSQSLARSSSSAVRSCCGRGSPSQSSSPSSGGSSGDRCCGASGTRPATSQGMSCVMSARGGTARGQGRRLACGAARQRSQGRAAGGQRAPSGQQSQRRVMLLSNPPGL